MKKSLCLALLVTLVAFIASFTAGCSKSREEMVKEASILIWQNKNDEAIAILDKLLAQDPADVDALRGMANAYGKKKDTENQIKYLKAARELPNLSDENRRFFDEQLERIYLTKAEDAERIDNTTAFQAALEEAVKYNEKSKANHQLARLYDQQASRLRDQNKLNEAAELYMKITRLAVSSREKISAEGKADFIYFGFFKESFQADFKDKHQPKLVAKGLFDPKTSLFILTGEYNVPAELDKKDPDTQDIGHTGASMAGYRNLLAGLAELLNRELPESLPSYLEDFTPASWKTVQSTWTDKDNVFAVSGTVSMDDGLTIAYLVDKATK